MRAPEKPKRPPKATDAKPCLRCRGRGIIKEFDGIYDYSWEICHWCKGTCFISTEEQDRINNEAYERDMAEYLRRMERHKILREIKITEEQLDALDTYGTEEFRKDYLRKKDKS